MHHETNGIESRSAGVVVLLAAMPVGLLAATLALLRGFGLLDPTRRLPAPTICQPTWRWWG